MFDGKIEPEINNKTLYLISILFVTILFIGLTLPKELTSIVVTKLLKIKLYF